MLGRRGTRGVLLEHLASQETECCIRRKPDYISSGDLAPRGKGVAVNLHFLLKGGNGFQRGNFSVKSDKTGNMKGQL